MMMGFAPAVVQLPSFVSAGAPQPDTLDRAVWRPELPSAMRGPPGRRLGGLTVRFRETQVGQNRRSPAPDEKMGEEVNQR